MKAFARPLVPLALAASLAGLVASLGCSLLTELDGLQTGTTSSTASSAGGAGVGVGGGGGGAGLEGGGGAGQGGSPECDSPVQCPQPASCLVPACVEGQCGAAPAPLNALSDNQVTGDCIEILCDGAGGEVLVVDVTDPCPGLKCSQAGACVECINANDCNNGQLCSGGVCVDCITDADCGGGGNPYCLAGQCVECIFSAQCNNQQCINGECGG